MGAFDSRGPQGPRGLKRCLPLVVYLLGLGRGPQGPRGLKPQRRDSGPHLAGVAVRKDRKD